jgi:cell filamentation protein
MAGNRDQDEARWTRFRAAELAAEPVAGHFDAAHLREINRRLFQDLPNLGYNDATPGEYRPPVEGNHDWYKTRALEGHAARPVVAYSRMDDSARQEIDRALRAAEPARLSPLATADFTDAIADLYTRLDYLHPFPDGNSRTLRMFTHQLAEASGFELDWSRFAQSGAGRNVLYVARDLSVNRLALDRIGSDETRRQVTLTLDQFDGNRDLSDLLKDAVRPHRAIAFTELDKADALAVFPELEPAYSALRAAVEHSLAKMPDSADQRQQFQTAVREEIQTRLDAGEIVQYRASAVARHRPTSDEDLER